MATKKKTSKKAPELPCDIPGKTCPHCGEQYENPVAVDWVNYPEWLDYPHADPFACIRHLRKIMERGARSTFDCST